MFLTALSYNGCNDPRPGLVVEGVSDFNSTVEEADNEGVISMSEEEEEAIEGAIEGPNLSFIFFNMRSLTP